MIVAINGTRVERWEDMAQLIALSDGKQIEVTVQREGSEFKVTIVPELKIDKIFGAEIKSYIIGIGSGGDARRTGPARPGCLHPGCAPSSREIGCRAGARHRRSLRTEMEDWYDEVFPGDIRFGLKIRRFLFSGAADGAA